MYRRPLLALVSLALTAACRDGNARPAKHDTTGTLATAEPSPAVLAAVPDIAAGRAKLAPNEMGRIPIFEYHLIGDTEGRWARHRDRFRQDLELLYERGYRPVTVSELVDKKLDLPKGTSPVVFTFDDASPSQLRYVERNGKLEIDPTSAVGIWLDFARTHRGWGNRATFCVLSGAAAGHNLFGDKGIEGQQTAWRFQKVRWLSEQGFELCAHTLWHANLAKYADPVVQEQIARNVMAIDSAVPGYRVRTFALPLGVWPKNRALAIEGSWREPKRGRTASYKFDAVMEVSGTAVRSPYDPAFNPHDLERIQVIGNALQSTLDHLDRTGTRYVSDGNPATIARPQPNTVAAGTPAPPGSVAAAASPRAGAAKHAPTRRARTR
jgi:hypothetical protein